MPELCNVRALSLLILFAELIATVLLLAAQTPSWARFGWLSLLVQWIVLVCAGALCATRAPLARAPLMVGALGAWAAIVFAAVLVTWVAGHIGEWVAFDYFDPFDLLRNGVIAALIGGMALRYFFVQQQLRIEQASALQSRIQALQSRIRPHFLFNSMNSIASLIPVDQEMAEAAVEDLAALFRASLEDAGNQVPLEHELALTRRYLRIEALRLDERLRIEWDVGELPQGLRIPQLTLQPLVENAIYHGIQPRIDGGTVSIGVRYERGVVQLTVRNPLPPDNAARPPPGNGIAVQNIRTRLEALYGASARLSSAQRGDTWEVIGSYPFSLATAAAASAEPSRSHPRPPEQAP